MIMKKYDYEYKADNGKQFVLRNVPTREIHATLSTYEEGHVFGEYVPCHYVDDGLVEEENITDYAREHGHLPLTDATDIELLEMWAIADNYWLHKYQGWLKRSEEKSSKLDRFIGECEMKYFGYDEDGYTDKTVDRIFKSIFEILEGK